MASLYLDATQNNKPNHPINVTIPLTEDAYRAFEALDDAERIAEVKRMALESSYDLGDDITIEALIPPITGPSGVKAFIGLYAPHFKQPTQG